jgi:hypothetical protein
MPSAFSVFRRPRGFTCSLDGLIASAAFSSGHRFVVGVWHASPVGPMCDVMWALPDGERVLLVGTGDVGTFISAIYGFDRVERTAMECTWDGAALRVTAGDVELVMWSGRRRGIPLARLRSLPVSRWVEAPIARRLLGVRTFGTSPTGVFEWYRAFDYRRVVEARASLEGTDLGSLCQFEGTTGFGFSEPPRRPSVVGVRPLLIDPTGNLEAVIARVRPTPPSPAGG